MQCLSLCADRKPPVEFYRINSILKRRSVVNIEHLVVRSEEHRTVAGIRLIAVLVVCRYCVIRPVRRIASRPKVYNVFEGLREITLGISDVRLNIIVLGKQTVILPVTVAIMVVYVTFRLRCFFNDKFWKLNIPMVHRPYTTQSAMERHNPVLVGVRNCVSCSVYRCSSCNGVHVENICCWFSRGAKVNFRPTVLKVHSAERRPRVAFARP